MIQNFVKNHIFFIVFSGVFLFCIDAQATFPAAGHKFAEGEVRSEIYADNLLSTFSVLPILDYESSLLYPEELELFTLKPDDKLGTHFTIPKYLKGGYEYVLYDGQEQSFTMGKVSYKDTVNNYRYYHPYSRLEELRQMALSFKPNPNAIRKMQEEKSTLYPLSTDGSRSFNDAETKATSENRTVDYIGGEQHAGIKQILFYSKNDYENAADYNIKVLDIDLMKPYRDNRKKKNLTDDREPLKIAAWYEKKFLMPLQIKWTPKGKIDEVELKGGESVGNTILNNRRLSLLQETIVESIQTTAFVQIKTAELLNFLGNPNSATLAGTVGIGSPTDPQSLLTALVGKDINFINQGGKFAFSGNYMSKDSAETDINGAIKSNFIARQTFSRLLSVYQQIMAQRLKLLSVATMTNGSPKVQGDDTGTGPIRQLYNEDIKDKSEIK